MTLKKCHLHKISCGIFIAIFLLFFISNICYGYFFPTNNYIIIKNQQYTLAYDTNLNISVWCEYTLSSNNLCNLKKYKRKDDFRVDPYLYTNNYSCVFPKIYKKSGYDKGHLCPAQDMCWNKEYLSETFYMSNMTPQKPEFNRGIWKKLEEYTRNYCITNNSIIVITGPVIFDTKSNIDNKIYIPIMYYKIIVSKNNVLCFMIPNEKCEYKITDYIVNLKYLKTILKFK